VKFYVIKKGNFYKGISKDSYNRSKLMVKIWNDNNLLENFVKYSKIQTCGILKLWKFKVYTFGNLEFQNFKNSLAHINGV
jgi:hypothetical protein